MTLEPIHLQIIGIAIVILIGAATLWWIVRSAVGFQDGHPIAWLFNPRHDDDGDEDAHVNDEDDGQP